MEIMIFQFLVSTRDSADLEKKREPWAKGLSNISHLPINHFTQYDISPLARDTVVRPSWYEPSNALLSEQHC